MPEGGLRPPKPLQISADTQEQWEDWLQSFEWYADAVSLSSKSKTVQVATFMSCIGRDAQQIFKIFALGADEKENLQVIKDKFQGYFTPKVNFTFERYKFNQIHQKPGECFKDFLTRLKIQASRCKLGIMEEELICDRIVVGMENNDVREKLLSDADLNLDKAVQICLASENASKQLKNIVDDNKSQPIISAISKKFTQSHKLGSQIDKPNSNTKFFKLITDCRNCGSTHKINECPAFGKKCNVCQKQNHFAKKCRSKFRKKYKVQEIENVDTITEDENFLIASVNANKADWCETVIINNKAIPMKLDTGAQCNVIPFRLAKELKLKIKPSNIRKLLSYSGHAIDVAGESLVPCKIKDKRMQLKVIIAHGGISPVLGRITCIEAGLIQRIELVNAVEEEFKDLFQGIGCIKNFEYTAEFSEECAQKEIKSPRRVPFKIRKIVKQELDRMVKDGIIKKVDEATPICNHMVIVKQHGKIRICIDPSDLNKILLRRQFPLKTLEEVTANAFEDALDGLHIDGLPSLDESIKEAKLALDLFFQNKFAAALSSLMPWAHVSTYHALGKGTMLFMQALLTMESKEIEKAAEALKQAIDVCQRKRKKHTVSKMIRRPDYNLYTEEEVHAELCYAECLLLTAILTFVEDQSLVNFVRGSLRIRTCYHSYKECMHILESRRWGNELRKKHFESGVRMGVGAFNLMISQLPTKVLKLLEFIGFSGNRQLGLKELDDGYAIKESLRSPLCALILVTFHTLVTFIFGCGDGDIDASEKIVNEMLERYPEAALFIFLSGRIKQLKGNIDDAIKTYHLSISVQEEWKQFHYLCYWELLWCNCFKCDWKEASRCSDILRLECKWSPAIYAYVHASILYMMMEDGHPELKDTIMDLMEKVPSLKQRLAGKSIPMEKYVVRKANKFISQGGRLIVPALELMYIWNSFPMIAKSRELTQNILCYVNNIYSSLEDAKDEEGPLDDYCLILLLRGVCYASLGRNNQAEDCFREIISCEKRVKEDVYLIPFAMAELGFIKMKQNNAIEAKELLEPARQNYHGYPLETILHFRVHSILRQLRAKGHVIPSPSPKCTPLHSPDPSPNRGGDIPEFPYLKESPTVPKRNLLQPPSDLGSCVSLP